MDASFIIAENAAETEFPDLSGEVVEATKRYVFDVLVAIIAGSSASGVGEILEQVTDWGGKGESTILVHGTKVPAPQAALLNSVMSHARELDDIHDGAHVHPSITIFPAVLATAEAVGGVSGRTFSVALALGMDLACRMGLATRNDTGWHWSTNYGYMGAALAAGKILGLNAKEMHDALGIAYSMTGGTMQNLADAAVMKRVQPGFSAKGGVESALLAKRGVTGCKGVLEGKYGYYNLYERGAYDRDELIRDLGKRFEGINTSIKLYPCCRCTHAAIDGMFALLQRKELNDADVRDVEVVVPGHVYEVVGRPFQIRDNPTVDAQFSIQYTLAASLIRKGLSLKDFEEEAVRDPEVLELAKKIRISADHSIKGRPNVPATVKVAMKSGEVISETIEIMRGDPRNRLSWDELWSKAVPLRSYATPPFPEGRLKEILRAVQQLEHMKDVRELANLCTAGKVHQNIMKEVV
jgi:2-methylcitrate dehydratase PrpD